MLVRFVSLSETQRSEARLRIENQRLAADYDTMLGLFNALSMPAWLRSADGRLKWVNRAYARAVEAENAEAAVRDAKEFLGGQARDAIAAQHKSHPVFEQALSTVIEGDRRMFAVTDFAGADGSAGLACDTSAIETIRSEYERTVRSHADTLDQLNTAVAIFDTDEKLRFFNQAFQKLWGLDNGFLHSAPDNALLLDRLRSEGKIAEQPEWRRWKESLLGAYRAVESQEHWWHLPDGKTIRVVANPQPKGGVTWVFENLTEKMDLESRYQTAVRVQGETLDNLAEGVAVFGPDGQAQTVEPGIRSTLGARRRRRQAQCSRLHDPRSVRPARRRQPLARVRCRRHRFRRRAPRPPRPDRAEQRHRAALRDDPAAQRPGDDDLRRRHRQRQCRAGAEGQERGTGKIRPAQERVSCSTSPTSCARR